MAQADPGKARLVDVQLSIEVAEDFVGNGLESLFAPQARFDFRTVDMPLRDTLMLEVSTFSLHAGQDRAGTLRAIVQWYEDYVRLSLGSMASIGKGQLIVCRGPITGLAFSEP